MHAMVAHCYDYAHCLYAFLLPMLEGKVMSVNAMQVTAMNANAMKLPISGNVISWLYKPSCRCLYLPCILLAIQAKL